ncbi:MAG: hypothetical protein ABW199_11440 [Caulobacterales bacterium]
MQIGTILSYASLASNLIGKAAEIIGDAFDGQVNAQSRTENSAEPQAANSAGNAAWLHYQTAHAAFETQQAAQSQIEEVSAPTARDVFMEYVKKSPMERMIEQLRKNAMEELGVTKDSMDQMSVEDRAEIEDKIKKIIEEKLREAMRIPEDGAQNAEAKNTPINVLA